jgi:hypothetical protein
MSDDKEERKKKGASKDKYSTNDFLYDNDTVHQLLLSTGEVTISDFIEAIYGGINL